jgi:hypothetical protein
MRLLYEGRIIGSSMSYTELESRHRNKRARSVNRDDLAWLVNRDAIVPGKTGTRVVTHGGDEVHRRLPAFEIAANSLQRKIRPLASENVGRPVSAVDVTNDPFQFAYQRLLDIVVNLEDREV